MTYFWQNPMGRSRKEKLSKGDKVEIAYFLSELSPEKREELADAAVRTADSWEVIAQEASLRAYGQTVGKMDPVETSDTIAYFVSTGQWQNVVREADAAFERRWGKKQSKKRSKAA